MSLAAGSLAGFPSTITRSMHTTPHIPNLQTPTNDSRYRLHASRVTDDTNIHYEWKFACMYVLPAA
jgi:hypothetical protein